MRSENLNIRAAAGRAGASEKLDIRAAAGITGAYVAYMMGSGFSTGQEILQYFACYGMAGLFSILLCMGLLIFAAVSFIRAGYREQFKKPEDVYVYYCGKRLGRAYHYFTTVSIYLCFIVMVAAAGAAVEQHFGISRIAGALAIGALACATVMLGLNNLVSILGHIGPFMILMVILMGVITICRSNLTAAAETIARIPEMKLLRASPSWVLASVSYVGISVVWLASYLTSIGRRAKSIASASVGAAGGVIAFYIGMLLIYFAIMLNIDELAGAQIPMLILAGRISPVTSGVLYTDSHRHIHGLGAAALADRLPPCGGGLPPLQAHSRDTGRRRYSGKPAAALQPPYEHSLRAHRVSWLPAAGVHGAEGRENNKINKRRVKDEAPDNNPYPSPAPAHRLQRRRKARPRGLYLPAGGRAGDGMGAG